MQEYSIQRSQRRCHESDRTFHPGERFYSVVLARGGDLKRIDVASDVWQGPPEGVIGWWANRMPEKTQEKLKPAPAHVLISALESLLEEGTQPELAYLLALLLIRRRILCEQQDLGVSEPRDADVASGLMHLTHHASNRDFVVPICEPPLDESQRYQDELTRLLFCEA